MHKLDVSVTLWTQLRARIRTRARTRTHAHTHAHKHTHTHTRAITSLVPDECNMKAPRRRALTRETWVDVLVLDRWVDVAEVKNRCHVCVARVQVRATRTARPNVYCV
jgi:hypothetical protein